MKIETSELEGAALDWAVAKADEVDVSIAISHDGYEIGTKVIGPWNTYEIYEPTKDWRKCGCLIDKYKIDISNCVSGSVIAESMVEIQGDDGSMSGPTPLIAVCRAVVAYKIGKEVEVPDELL